MITVGIDLASQPVRTGLCVLEWAGEARCLELRTGVDDGEIVAAATASDKCGIDVPLGWPDDFVATVATHHAGGTPPSIEGTERLRMRATDIWVWRRHGRRPLSVSTDLIGVTALRAVQIQRMMAAATGRPVDRTGAGLVVETYPAAALAAWGLPSSRYKGATPGSDETLAELAVAVTERFDVALDPADARLAATNDDAFDALVCAIVARLAATGRTTGPPADLADVAAREGWIHVPDAGEPG